MADRLQRHAAAAPAPGRAAKPTEAPLLTLEDVGASSTAELVAKVAGDALRPATPRQQGGQGTAALAELLARFERCVCGSGVAGMVSTRCAASRRCPAGLQALATQPSPMVSCRADRELARLQQQADARAERLRRDAAAGGAGQGARVAGLEGQWGSLREGFSGLEGRMTAATQAATKIGNRLQARGGGGRAAWGRTGVAAPRHHPH